MAVNPQSSDGKPKMSGHIKDLTGQKFNRLEVLEFAGRNKHNTALWKCKCDCGNITTATTYGLTHGAKKSCGCYHIEKSRENFKDNATHGLSKTQLYTTWKNMRQRCNNPHNKRYSSYGGRGIGICDEWNDYQVFHDWMMEHGWEPGLTLERIDNDKGYSPDNCRIATWKEQVRNRRKTVYLTYKNEKKPLSEWVEIFGLNMKTCYGRLHDYGWSNPEEILFGRAK